jgi:hypothetical protein
MHSEPEFKYYLDPGSRKFECPRCAKKRFVRYIDINGHYLDNIYGRCDRESSCSYHLHPNEFKPSLRPRLYPIKQNQIEIPAELVKLSRSNYENNDFVRYLNGIFGEKNTIDLIKKFHLGTSILYKNAVIFWQIDVKGIVRTGHIMQYNPVTGKRTGIQSWVHAELKKKGKLDTATELSQCFFGEHQLRLRPSDAIGIVESEKSAVIASHFFPEIIWLACCGKHGLNESKMKVLGNRWVCLYPDASSDNSTYTQWSRKVDELKKICERVDISNLLELFCDENEKAKGVDIADYLLKNSGIIASNNT